MALGKVRVKALVGVLAGGSFWQEAAAAFAKTFEEA
jgi:hypothetical protein